MRRSGKLVFVCFWRESEGHIRCRSSTCRRMSLKPVDRNSFSTSRDSAFASASSSLLCIAWYEMCICVSDATRVCKRLRIAFSSLSPFISFSSFSFAVPLTLFATANIEQATACPLIPVTSNPVTAAAAACAVVAQAAGIRSRLCTRQSSLSFSLVVWEELHSRSFITKRTERGTCIACCKHTHMQKTDASSSRVQHQIH